MDLYDQAALDFLSLVSDRFPDWEIAAGLVFPVLYVEAVEPKRAIDRHRPGQSRFFEAQVSVAEIAYDPFVLDRLERELDTAALHAWVDNPA